VRHALASGTPVAALETTLSSAMVGPAAYLVPGEDDRAMGAALITLLVEDEVREQLLKAAAGRVQNWSRVEFDQALLGAYHKLF
jgi:glycosyltransferase involved in cell wall biosynthesis